MKMLTTSEAIDWVRATGLTAGPRESVALPTDGYVFTVRWPKILPYQVPYFAGLFLPNEITESWLFWITDNGASGAMEFEIACHELKRLRTSHGETRALLDSPAYLFDEQDIVDARLLTTMAVLYLWGVYLIPQHGRYFVWIDDDEAADVCCRYREDYRELLERFRKWGLTPEEISAPKNE